MRKEAINTFQNGLVYDLNPITTPDNVLTDNVNGTFITFNGDELALQNDAGNAAIDTHFTLATEYDQDKDNITSEGHYSLGNRVFEEVAAEEVGDNSREYYLNINRNLIANGNFTSGVIPGNSVIDQWFFSGNDLKVSLSNNTVDAVHLEGDGVLYQNLSLLKNIVYKFSSYSQGSITFKLEYFLNNTLEHSITATLLPTNIIVTPDIDFDYVKLSFIMNGGSFILGNLQILSTGIIVLDGNQIQGDLTNRSIWAPITKVSLSDGFMPLAIKEYGGVLYIISAKKGASGRDEIEFGSYPSPEVIDFHNPNVSILNQNPPETLNKDLFPTYSKYTPGTKVKFNTTINSGDLSNISKYENGEWVRSVYKLGLYHKLENSVRDLTKEYSRYSETGYWFNSTKEFFNKVYYKGDLFSRLEIEPIDEFELIGSTLVQSGNAYDWELDFSHVSTCGLEISKIEVAYKIGTEITSTFEFYPNWINGEDSYTISISNPQNYIGMSLSYVITPKFSLKSNPTEILTDNIGYSDVTDYTKNYIINGNRLIPSIYELVDLEYASWKTDMVTPTIFEYEYEDSILSGLSTCNELIIRNEEGVYLDSNLNIITGSERYGFNLSGNNLLDPILTNVLGSYSITEEGNIPGTATALQPVLDRVSEMTLQRRDDAITYAVSLNYDVAVSRDDVNNSITYLSSDILSILPINTNLTLYHKPLNFVDITYEGSGVYKNSSNVQVDVKSIIHEFLSPKGKIKVGYYKLTDENYLDIPNGVYDANATITVDREMEVNLAVISILGLEWVYQPINTGGIRREWVYQSGSKIPYVAKPKKYLIDQPDRFNAVITGYAKYVRRNISLNSIEEEINIRYTQDSMFYKLQDPWTPVIISPSNDLYYYTLMIDLDILFPGKFLGTVAFGTGIYYIDDADPNIKREISFILTHIELASGTNLSNSYYNLPENLINLYYRDEYGIVSPRYLNIQ